MVSAQCRPGGHSGLSLSSSSSLSSAFSSWFSIRIFFIPVLTLMPKELLTYLIILRNLMKITTKRMGYERVAKPEHGRLVQSPICPYRHVPLDICAPYPGAFLAPCLF